MRTSGRRVGVPTYTPVVMAALLMLASSGISGCCAADPPAECGLSWLVGTWSGQSDEEMLTQRWERVHAGEFTGSSEVTVAGRAVERERWTLRWRRGHWSLEVTLADGESLHYEASGCDQAAIQLQGAPTQYPHRVRLASVDPVLQLVLEGLGETGVHQRTTVRLTRQP